MEVAFSERLKRAIGDEGQHLQKKLGHLSRRFKMRIDQMKAADHYYEYQSIGLGRPHLLDGDLKGCFAVDLTGNYRIIARLGTDDLSPEALKICDEVIIEGVVDYHGKGNNWFIP